MIIVRCISILALVFVTHSAHATRQISDPLVWKGETVYPESAPSIWEAFPEKEKPKFDMDSTANWKGYRAEWEIKDDLLLLVSVKGEIDGRSVRIGDLFPGKKSPISATWFSGTLIIPRGKEIGLMKGEARYVYTKEMHLTIEKGKVVKTEEKTFDPKKTPVCKI